MAKHWTTPREHGAWGMLYVPLTLALLETRHFSWDAALLALSATFAFLSRAPLQAAARAWRWRKPFGEPLKLGAIYLTGAGTCGGWLIVSGYQGLLLPAAAGTAILGLNLMQSIDREEKSLAAELLAAAALSLTAPAAHYLALREWSADAWILWLLCAGFFTSGILYIKLRIAGISEKVQGERQRLRRISAAYHVLLPALLVAAVIAGKLSWVALLAFAPVTVRGLRSSFGPLSKLNLRRAGWLEVAWSLVFLLVLGFGGW